MKHSGPALYKVYYWFGGEGYRALRLKGELPADQIQI
jgi:hypothetical protein